MSDTSMLSAAVGVVAAALGLAIQPDQIMVGLTMGMMGSYLIRAISPKDSRAEAWLIPLAAVFVGIFGVMAQPHLPWGLASWHPSLIMATAGSFSVPVLRAMQAAGVMLPMAVRRFGKAKMGASRDE